MFWLVTRLPEGEMESQGQLVGLVTAALKFVVLPALTVNVWLTGAVPPAAPVKFIVDVESVRLPVPVLPLARTTTGIVYGLLNAPEAVTFRLAVFRPLGRPLPLIATEQVAGVLVSVQTTVMYDAEAVTCKGRLLPSLARKKT